MEYESFLSRLKIQRGSHSFDGGLLAKNRLMVKVKWNSIGIVVRVSLVEVDSIFRMDPLCGKYNYSVIRQ